MSKVLMSSMAALKRPHVSEKHDGNMTSIMGLHKGAALAR